MDNYVLINIVSYSIVFKVLCIYCSMMQIISIIIVYMYHSIVIALCLWPDVWFGDLRTFKRVW